MAGGPRVAHHAHRGRSWGTPAYMAPEQLESRTVDAAGRRVQLQRRAVRGGSIGAAPSPATRWWSCSRTCAGPARVIAPPPGPVPEGRLPRRRPAGSARASTSAGARWRALLDAPRRRASTPPSKARRPVAACRPGSTPAAAGLVVVGGNRSRGARGAGQGQGGSPRRGPRPTRAPTTPPLVFHPEEPAPASRSNEGCELSPSYTPDGKTIVYKSMGASDSAPLFRARRAGRGRRAADHAGQDVHLQPPPFPSPRRRDARLQEMDEGRAPRALPVAPRQR